MQVMLLAAGRSTRLGPLGLSLPKPLVPVCGHAPLAYGLALCRAAGLRDVVVNLHHHGDAIRSALGDGARFGADVRYSDEVELLGTGGGLVAARALFRSEPVLVMNGKVVADVELAQVIEAHRRAPAGTVATMVLRPDPRPERFAPVELDEATGRVVALRGTRAADAPPAERTRALMFTGIHIVESALLDRLPRGGFSDVIGDAYLPALTAGARIGGVVMDGYFEEHSTPDRYLAGNVALLRAPDRLRTPPGPLVGVDDGAHVDPLARIVHPVRVAAGAVVDAGAVVGPDVVVGEGGVVAAGAILERVVVWSGARASGTLRDAIVTPNGVVDARG